jgi:hypothetical protein
MSYATQSTIEIASADCRVKHNVDGELDVVDQLEQFLTNEELRWWRPETEVVVIAAATVVGRGC